MGKFHIQATKHKAIDVVSEFDPDTKVVLAQAHDIVMEKAQERIMCLELGLRLVKDPFGVPRQILEKFEGKQMGYVLDQFLNQDEELTELIRKL